MYTKCLLLAVSSLCLQGILAAPAADHESPTRVVRRQYDTVESASESGTGSPSNGQNGWGQWGQGRAYGGNKMFDIKKLCASGGTSMPEQTGLAQTTTGSVEETDPEGTEEQDTTEEEDTSLSASSSSSSALPESTEEATARKQRRTSVMKRSVMEKRALEILKAPKLLPRHGQWMKNADFLKYVCPHIKAGSFGDTKQLDNSELPEETEGSETTPTETEEEPSASSSAVSSAGALTEERRRRARM